ncbi:uracil phosphoribosyltransferase-domain-containing protein [Gorgonomyces haynaldii]|nr:uracil phosphoribosyltransferase-domain-containing protein [Gorgonomyces haynaldii]
MAKRVNHPLFLHKLSQLRDTKTTPKEFRDLVSELTTILGVQATSDLDLSMTKQKSPITEFSGYQIKDRIGVFPILRAGSGMLSSFLNLLPMARVHHLGLYREKSTLLPVEYYNKLPQVCQIDVGIVIDPMVATAGTAIAAINMLKDWGLKKIKFVCILASKEGIDLILKQHPDVQVYVGHIDEELTAEGYLTPGCGDAGDRIFNTAYDH